MLNFPTKKSELVYWTFFGKKMVISSICRNMEHFISIKWSIHLLRNSGLKMFYISTTNKMLVSLCQCRSFLPSFFPHFVFFFLSLRFSWKVCPCPFFKILYSPLFSTQHKHSPNSPTTNKQTITYHTSHNVHYTYHSHSPHTLFTHFSQCTHITHSLDFRFFILFKNTLIQSR